MNIIYTQNYKMKKLIELIDKVASSRSTILLQGESGTGKELFSRYIHAKSARNSNRFYAINTAAVPENLLESELFGFEKGAFTGASQRKIGKFEQANGSTLLLDEISEMPLVLQAKILRVLQENEIERVGGTESIPVNVRLVAATNRNLGELVKEGKFREDLYYRLNVIPVTIPPLRSRLDDIEILSPVFIESVCRQNNIDLKVLSKEALEKLKKWQWPGNVRELKNILERSCLLSDGNTISSEEIIIENYKEFNSDELQPGMTVSKAEKLLILKTLDYTKQNRTHAADLLGISVRTLRNKINEYKCDSELKLGA